MKAVIRRLLRSSVVARVVGWLVARLITTYFRTIRVHLTYEVLQCHQALAQDCGIYCAWHENLLLWAYVGAHSDCRVLVSESNDGEYITRILKCLGFGTVRGSSTRGAVRALRRLVRSGGTTHVAITPDGPRGPRQNFQQGAAYLASRTGMTLVPMGFAFDRPWRASSWDRMALPRPFSKAVCYGGTPITVPPDADANELARYHQLASDALHHATEQAERLIEEVPSDAKFRYRGPGKHMPELDPALAVPEREAA